jgi:hypothetical protein
MLSMEKAGDFETAQKFIELLDENRFVEAAALMRADCVYRFRGRTVRGAEAVIQVYISNYEAIAPQLDEIHFSSELLGAEEGGVFRVKFLDRIRKGASRFEHRCEQRIFVENHCIYEITHVDLPGETDRLKDWFSQVGIQRAEPSTP